MVETRPILADVAGGEPRLAANQTFDPGNLLGLPI
jgi:hypothetical protein